MSTPNYWDKAKKFWDEKEAFESNFDAHTPIQSAFLAGQFAKDAEKLIDDYHYKKSDQDTRNLLTLITETLLTSIRYASLSELINDKNFAIEDDEESINIISAFEKYSKLLEAEQNERPKNNDEFDNFYMDVCVSQLNWSKLK